MTPPKLIPEWRRSWRMFSVQVGVLTVAWGALPVDIQAHLLALVGVAPAHVPSIIGALFIVARLVAQPRLRNAK